MIAQFGVGLLATGLALVFRLILTARVESLNAKDLSQTIDEYVQRIDHIVVKVEASAANFEALSQSPQERTRAVVEATYEECTASLRSAATVFLESIAGISEQTSQSVTRFGQVVESVPVASHVEHFDSSIMQLNTDLKNFAAEVSKFGRLTTDEALRTTKQALDASSKWHVESLNEMSNASQQSIRTALATLENLDMSVDTSNVKSDLQALSRNIGSFSKKFSELDDKLASAHTRHSVEALEPIVEKFAEHLVRATGEIEIQALAQFNDATSRLTKEVVNGVEAASDRAQAETTQQIDALTGHIHRLSVALERADQQPAMERNGQRIDALAGNVDRLIVSLAKADQQGATERSAQAVDALAGNVDRLLTTLQNGLQSGNEQNAQRIDALAVNVDRLIGVLERSATRNERHSARMPPAFVSAQGGAIQIETTPASRVNPA
ncbi:hypothetical protein [Paraburkholderia kirstenboschensis]|uniref:Methyl-accepting chemotaxis protein n=1 Tax=Paraburkholderia kirstenboschensis TaxID=1245436 RepID=A0ABZ0EQS9_9BURK|nr:hypothetical protein [Paraburkholderia kirstenboschensis]WOD18951.1 hypothetical protein RW095_40470 [Paraburkholderia kirstenboschensis]